VARNKIRGLPPPGRVPGSQENPVSPERVGPESPVSPEREHQERTVRAAPSVTTDVTRIEEMMSLERLIIEIQEHLVETTTPSDMREVRAREEDIRTTTHPVGAEEVEGAECLVEEEEGELQEEVAEVIRTTVIRTMKSTMITDLAVVLKVEVETTDRDVGLTAVRMVVEERTTGPRERTAQKEIVPQEDADSATVVARVIRETAQEESVRREHQESREIVLQEIRETVPQESPESLVLLLLPRKLKYA